MADIRITLSANAGIVLRVGTKKIWVDALHTQHVPGFSSLDQQLVQQTFDSPEFANPDYIFYTHCHPDHYSRELTLTAMEKWPNAKVILPQQELPGQILLEGERFCIEDGDIQLRFIKLPHASQIYAHVPMYGLIISLPQGNILLPADCEVAAPQLAAAVGSEKIDLAIVDFPWITLNRGRAFLNQLQPKQLVCYHLPFEKDDVGGYRVAAARSAEKMQPLAVRFLRDPLQTMEIKI